MTTFVDREHAIEAHQSILDLAEFRERSRQIKTRAFAFGKRIGLDDPTAASFAQALAQRSIAIGKDVSSLGWWSSDTISPPHIATPVIAENDSMTAKHGGRMDVYATQSWAEFVITQLFLLFWTDRSSTTNQRAGLAAQRLS